jgi:hypothetical protein
LNGTVTGIKLGQWALDPMKSRPNFKQLGHAWGRWPTIGLPLRSGHQDHGGEESANPEAVQNKSH